MKRREIITASREETLALGEELGRAALRGDVYALTGGLGTGKTVLAKGIALGMGIRDEITSPTFTLLEVYDAPLPLYHFDLYRIESERELDNLGFEEYWEGDGVSVIEWAERAGSRLPAGRTVVRIEYANGDKRKVTIERPDH